MVCVWAEAETALGKQCATLSRMAPTPQQAPRVGLELWPELSLPSSVSHPKVLQVKTPGTPDIGAYGY